MAGEWEGGLDSNRRRGSGGEVAGGGDGFEEVGGTVNYLSH